MIDEPWGAFTCRSSTLTVFVDSDPFRGLLLIVVVQQGALTYRSSTITVLADSGPFLGLLLSFGVPK